MICICIHGCDNIPIPSRSYPQQNVGMLARPRNATINYDYNDDTFDPHITRTDEKLSTIINYHIMLSSWQLLVSIMFNWFNLLGICMWFVYRYIQHDDLCIISEKPYQHVVKSAHKVVIISWRLRILCTRYLSALCYPTDILSQDLNDQLLHSVGIYRMNDF